MVKQSFLVAGMLSLWAGLAVFMCLVLPAFSTHAAGTIYYVSGSGNDANSGTQSSPFRTIQKCASVAVAGGTCNIRGGFTYAELNVTTANSGTTGNPITFQTEPATGTATLQNGLTGTNNGSVFALLDRHHITFQNLTFANTTTGWAIYLESSTRNALATSFETHDITIQNCTFSNMGNPNLAPGGNIFSLSDEPNGAEGMINLGLTGPNVIFQNNTVTGGYGIVLETGGYQVRVLNNTISGVDGKLLGGNGSNEISGGIFAGPGQGALIQGNHVHDMLSVTEGAGGMWCDVGGINGVLKGNVFHDIPGVAVNIEAFCDDWVVEQNVVYNGVYGYSTATFFTPETKRITFQNNVAFNMQWFGFALQRSNVATVRNNIGMNNGQNFYTSDYAVSNGVTVSNNLWFNTGGGNHMVWNDATHSIAAPTISYAAYVAASGEANSKNQDPLFVNTGTGDFHLQAGSPAIDAGVNVGLPFNGSAPDMGALEYGGSGSPTPTPTPTLTPTPQTSAAINVGGSQYTATDGTYLADTYASGGTAYQNGNAIANSTDDPLYQSQRYGPLSYNIPIVNGTYNVTLKFAEIYYTTANMRIFNVSIEGTQVLSNFDIVASGGANTAVDRTFTTTVSDGSLTITLTAVQDNPVINAIKAVPAAAPTPTPTPTPTPGPH